MTVKCGEETRRYTNIIFGDVYLLAGQSNMEAWLSWIDSQNYAGEKERAENSNIRTIDLLSKAETVLRILAIIFRRLKEMHGHR